MTHPLRATQRNTYLLYNFNINLNKILIYLPNIINYLRLNKHLTIKQNKINYIKKQ